TGVTSNANLFLAVDDTLPPAASKLDFISGASMVVSRAFWDQAGPMCEDYFLYYEEVDWALQRGGLPLAVCPQGVVYHRAGSSIGSATLGRPASPFSLFFKNRARIMFMRRHFPVGLPGAWAYTLAKVAQYGLKGLREEAWAVLAGACNGVPPREVIDRLTPEAARVALSRKGLDVYNKSRD
ncbi:MAG: glycosyltransferase family 2 protein, partial [Roseovarius sp.]|nr:glycosyltransferase family 2 protein [Roseovarius sp.]